MAIAVSDLPEVSVLMSCYNAGRWLREAIESVLGQSFGNLELVIVDDGSTDDTAGIIREYCQGDRRIVSIAHTNMGLTRSLNIDLSRARGVWVARLDADDVCEPDRIKEQLGYVRKHPQVDLVGSGFVEIDSGGRIVKEHSFPRSHTALVSNLRRLKRFFPHSSAFFRREAALGLCGYNSRMSKAQDWDMWLRFSERYRLACVPQRLVRVRKHENQISNSTEGRPQLVHGCAATVCHFLRAGDARDPSVNDETWPGFIDWVAQQVVADGLVARRRALLTTRAAYLERTGPLGVLQAIVDVARTSQSRRALREKALGCDLPERLARQWVAHTNRLVPGA